MKQNLIQIFTKKKEVKDFIDIFYKQSVEIRFVGGCIRDALLNKKISDFDFAVKLRPEEVINILNSSKIKFDDFGKRYGSFIIRINKVSSDVLRHSCPYPQISLLRNSSH